MCTPFRVLLLTSSLAALAMFPPTMRSATTTGLPPGHAEVAAQKEAQSAASLSPEADTVNRIFVEALTHGRAYENLRTLVSQCPGRLAGSQAFNRAIAWGEHTLGAMNLDRVYKQEVMVPHWERGPRESVRLLPSRGDAVLLAATALGGSTASPAGGVNAEVIEVHALDELAALGREKIAGKIVFFNRPMNPAYFSTGRAYGEAGDQRFRGPAAAAGFGAIAVVTRSLTLAHDDFPHTGMTRFPAGTAPIPCAALSTLAADRLSAALVSDPKSRIEIKIHAQTLPDVPAHNVIGELRGSQFPDQIIVVGGHLDSWDITPGAHDDGAGVVQSIEVLRVFKALGLKPRHTVRCVLFANEENGLAGATAYAANAQKLGEHHVFAVETDAGGFAPSGFTLDNKAGDAPERAARWLPVFRPWGVWNFRKGSGGADVDALSEQGATTAELATDSQRYFDIHHTTADTIDKVNPRELHLGAGALASLIWLIDSQGL
jgi:hypothetical protein